MLAATCDVIICSSWHHGLVFCFDAEIVDCNLSFAFATTFPYRVVKSGTAKNVIRLLPPLTTPPDELALGLDILAGVCREVLA